MRRPSAPRKQTHHRPRRGIWRALVVVAGLGLLGIIAGVAGVIGAYYYVAPGLPAAETIRDIPLQIPLRIFSRDGHLIEEIGQRRRILITYEDVPPHVVDAFIAAEDQRFFVHPGIDYRGILRALSQLVLTGDIASGGSTLTQQLARSYFLSLEQTAERKFKEASLAVRIEQEFTKEQIMELFLNKMFFGQRAYGVAAAAQVYFNKQLNDIDIAEAATLAGVLPAPSRYNPVRSPVNARMRRGYVLGRMLDLGYITDAEYTAATDQPVESRLHGAAVELNAPYVAEMVRREMLLRYGEDTAPVQCALYRVTAGEGPAVWYARQDSGDLVEVPSYWGLDDWPPYVHMSDIDFMMPISFSSTSARVHERRRLFWLISRPDTATPPALAALPGP